ncbi:glycosyltransferase [Methylosinus sp. LW3]|uniref:glycosyltransferase n=1 Tax=Methylosinus sp. LW3 TaxID=107635 RepID=UPI0004BCEC30|nr:glycosyltransferase [Methylosinus sp. LW3]
MNLRSLWQQIAGKRTEFQGHLDPIEGNRVRGWAWRPDAPQEPVCVRILLGENVVGTAEANIYRADLKSAGMGEGYHGFEASLDLKGVTQFPDGEIVLSLRAQEDPTREIDSRRYSYQMVTEQDDRGGQSNEDGRVSIAATIIPRALFAHRLASMQPARARETTRGRVWIDLTFSLRWTGGVAGMVRAELEIASAMKKIDPNVGFSVQIGTGFAEVPHEQLRWLFEATNVTDAYMTYFGRQKGSSPKRHVVKVDVPDGDAFFHPFVERDTIISTGFIQDHKEHYYSILKDEFPGVYISYLIYDIILIHSKTAHLYPKDGQKLFFRYMDWVSHHCDFLFYGGETARMDAITLQKREHWPTPPNVAVKFGTDIVKSTDHSRDADVLARLGISSPFVICVGSIEPRKNHDTLYRAYLLAMQRKPEGLPTLVVCGKPVWRADDILRFLHRDPRVQGRIIHLTPSDEELAVLYKNCAFTVLPSLYEGWSLPLPESLAQGKLCIACDTPALREIGGDMIDYAEPFDTSTWADKIILYSSNQQLLQEKEQKIRAQWKNILWFDTAQTMYNAVRKFSAQTPAAPAKARRKCPLTLWEEPTIWMDITLSFLHWKGGVNGIIRTELAYAYHLHVLRPNTRYFAYTHDYFFEIEHELLGWLFHASNISAGYKNFHEFWEPHEAAGTGHRNPFHSTGPIASHPAYLPRFPENAIIFFAAIDGDGTGKLSRNAKVFDVSSREELHLTSQLVYDFTPFLIPQFHLENTVRSYQPFIEHVSKTFDHIVYGGRTAQRDGIAIQKQNGWPVPPSAFIEFGSDLALADTRAAEPSPERDRALLSAMGLNGKFVMTVGTLEARKNHDMLYKAYLRILERCDGQPPFQMAFVGKKGWNTDDAIANMSADKRVRGNLVIVSPSDEQLDAMYRNCLFTLLPSFYEGWSLTLPESLSYGKFCLTSDVDPLKETGRDLVEYISPYDTYAWADRMEFFAHHPKELAQREQMIRKQWKPRSWQDSTQMLIDILVEAHKARFYELPSASDELQLDRLAAAESA